MAPWTNHRSDMWLCSRVPDLRRPRACFGQSGQPSDPLWLHLRTLDPIISASSSCVRVGPREGLFSPANHTPNCLADQPMSLLHHTWLPNCNVHVKCPIMPINAYSTHCWVPIKHVSSIPVGQIIKMELGCFSSSLPTRNHHSTH